MMPQPMGKIQLCFERDGSSIFKCIVYKSVRDAGKPDATEGTYTQRLKGWPKLIPSTSRIFYAISRVSMSVYRDDVRFGSYRRYVGRAADGSAGPSLQRKALFV